MTTRFYRLVDLSSTSVQRLSEEELRTLLRKLLPRTQAEPPYGSLAWAKTRAADRSDFAVEAFLPPQGFVDVVRRGGDWLGAYTIKLEPFEMGIYSLQMGKLVLAYIKEATASNISEMVASAFKQAQAEGIEHVAVRIDAKQVPLANTLAQAGCVFVGVHIVLQTKLLNVPSPASSWLAEECHSEDLEALKEIARVSFRESRFHQDPGLSQDRSDLLYKRWAENCWKERADKVLVVRRAGKPIGFVACGVGEDMDRNMVGGIELIATSPEARGQGIGLALLSAGLRWMAGRGCRQVWVDTQGSNLASLSLYQKTGFEMDRIHLDFHRRLGG